MKVLVCMSNVPDTTTKIRFTSEGKSLDATGIQWIINPWDELALTRVLELKDANAGAITEIAVMHVGGKDSEPTIRKALAIGADRGIRIDCEAKDAYYVAGQLTEAIKKESFDIILCGIESSDFNGASVGGMLSEFLEMPSVSSVSGMNLENGQLVLTREIDGGSESVETSMPFVGIVQKGIAQEPRIPSMRGIMQARTKPLAVVPCAELPSLTENLTYELPQAKAACKMVDSENVKELVQLLHDEAKVI